MNKKKRKNNIIYNKMDRKKIDVILYKTPCKFMQTSLSNAVIDRQYGYVHSLQSSAIMSAMSVCTNSSMI